MAASELPLGKMLPVQVLNDIADATWGKLLLGAGFVAIKPRLWVRSRLEFARDVFELSAVKGASYVARCGFSLNFVPHVQGGEVRWHRTAKSVVMDLQLPLLPQHELPWGLQPVGTPHPLVSHRGLEPTLLRSPKFNYELAQRLSPHDTSSAVDLLAQVTTLVELAAAFQWRKDTNALALREFYSFTQHPIAFAFTLARLNRLPEARLELAKFYEVEQANKSDLAVDQLMVQRLYEELEKASALESPNI